MLKLSKSFNTTLNNFLEVFVKWSSEFSGNCNAKRPDCREQETVFNNALNFLLVTRLVEIFIIENFKKCTKHTQECDN